MLVNDPAHRLESRIVEVQDPGGERGMLPRYLLKTDPPIGTPIPPGTLVTLEFSAGDLLAYVSEKSLVAQGWHVAQHGDSASRSRARKRSTPCPTSTPPGGGGGVSGIYLRQLNGQLVWLASLPPPRRKLCA